MKAEKYRDIINIPKQTNQRLPIWTSDKVEPREDEVILNVQVVKLGHDSPDTEEAASVVKHVLSRLSDDHEKISSIIEIARKGRLVLSLQVGSIIGDHGDRSKQISGYMRKQFPSGDILDVGLCTPYGGAYRVVFILPNTAGTSLKRIELIEDVLCLAQDRMDPIDLSGRFSENLDIRQLIGSWGCLRLGLLLAGSPGWNGEKKAVTVSKNEGTLVATWNDCNVFLQQLLALSPEDRLHGSACISTIQTRAGFFGLLKYIFVDKWQRQMEHEHLRELASETGKDIFELMSKDEFHALGRSGKINGWFATDAFLAGGSFSGSGFTEILPGGGVATFGVTVKDTDRLIPLEVERYIFQGSISDVDKYILIFYSGHGSEKGNIQIERDQTITPEELADYSKRKQVALFLILDMCHSWRFGQRFVDRLRQIKWKGIAMTANDAAINEGLAFESTIMVAVRKHSWPVTINEPNWTCGRGIFTSAFALALVYIYESEKTTGRAHTINVRSFTEEVVRTVCVQLHKNFGVPLIRPCLFSSY